MPWALLAVLVAQAVLSARLVWSNTAFQDEAEYLWLGHWELSHLTSGMPLPSSQNWFSGAPVLYPVLGAIADGLGGLAAARLLSLLFMLCATALLYLMTSRLFGRSAGIAAAAVFAALGPVQRLGAFATYDALALALLALASWLVVRPHGTLSERWLLTAAVIVTLANAAKYASALWDPVVAGLAVVAAPQPGLMRAWLRGARLLLYTAALAGTLLWLAGARYVQGLEFSTLTRPAGGVAASAVLDSSALWIGALVVLCLVAVAVSFAGTVRTRLLCGLLTAALLFAPLHQAQIHTLTSLSKHVAFGAWFAAAAAGYALTRVIPTDRKIRWLVPAAAVGVIGIAGVPQATVLFHGWPSSAQMIPKMRALAAATGCPCLASQSEVADYYLSAQPYAITGPYLFSYQKPWSHRQVSGIPAYTLAIRSHYFKVVEIDPYLDPVLFDSVTRALAATPGYQLADVITDPGSGTVQAEIWWYRPGQPPAGGWPYAAARSLVGESRNTQAGRQAGSEHGRDEGTGGMKQLAPAPCDSRHAAGSCDTTGFESLALLPQTGRRPPSTIAVAYWRDDAGERAALHPSPAISDHDHAGDRGNHRSPGPAVRRQRAAWRSRGPRGGPDRPMRQPSQAGHRAPVIAAAGIAAVSLAGWGLLLGSSPPHVKTPVATSFWALTHAPRIASQPTSGLMLGVYTPDLAGFDRAVGHRAALSVRYVNWGDRYPAVTVVAAATEHAETVLEIEPNNRGLPTARQIAEGKGDRWLRWFGSSIAGFGDPVAVSFEPEMNGPWHRRPWHEDPRDYIAAFRHLHDVLSQTHGGPLITWLWQPSAIHARTPNPMPWWPGSKYVDVVGLDGYYYSPADTFSEIFNRTISLARKQTSAPIMIGETAIGPLSGHQGWGIRNLFAGIRRHRLIGLIWFDQRQHAPPYHQDWRLEDNTAALAAFRAALASAGPLAKFAPIGPRY